MENAMEHCGRCGAVVYPFSKGVAVSSNSDYCVKCSEELDMHYLSRNVCSVCARILDKDDVKFVMPSRMYSCYFFDRLPLENRLMCTACYTKANRLNLIRKPLIKIGQIRLKIARKLVKRVLVGDKSPT